MSIIYLRTLSKNAFVGWQKADGYSFGVVLYEIFSKKVPWLGVDQQDIFHRIVDLGEKLTVPNDIPHPIAELVSDCLEVNPHARPLFDEIIEWTMEIDSVLKGNSNALSNRNSIRSNRKVNGTNTCGYKLGYKTKLSGTYKETLLSEMLERNT